MADIQFENIDPYVEETGSGDTGLTARQKLKRNFDKIKAWMDSVTFSGNYLSRVNDDIAEGVITFEKGSIFGTANDLWGWVKQSVTGRTGTGWAWFKHLLTDYIEAQVAVILSDLNVGGDLAVAGDTTLADLVADNITVNEDLQVDGDALIAGDLDVGGVTTLASLLVQGLLEALNIEVSNTITTKNLVVTGLARFFELMIDKIKASGGATLHTAADGFDVELIEDITLTVPGTGATVAGKRLLWRSTDENGKARLNEWKALDQALCATFNNARTGTQYDVSNKFFWALVAATDDNTPVEKTDADGNRHKYHYIDIYVGDGSSTVPNDANGTPLFTGDPTAVAVGDSIGMLGYRGTNDSARQAAIYESAYSCNLDPGLTPPLRAIYLGVDDFDLPSHRASYEDALHNVILASYLKIMTDGGTEKDFDDYLEDFAGQDGHDGQDGADGVNGIDGLTVGFVPSEVILTKTYDTTNDTVGLDMANGTVLAVLQARMGITPLDGTGGTTAPVFTQVSFDSTVINLTFSGNQVVFIGRDTVLATSATKTTVQVTARITFPDPTTGQNATTLVTLNLPIYINQLGSVTSTTYGDMTRTVRERIAYEISEGSLSQVAYKSDVQDAADHFSRELSATRKGKNLIMNGDFMVEGTNDAPARFYARNTIGSDSYSKLTRSADTTCQDFCFTCQLKITASSSTRGLWLPVTSDSLQPYIKLEDGVTYTLSFWCKSNVAISGSLGIMVKRGGTGTSNNVGLATQIGGMTINLDTSWHRYSRKIEGDGNLSIIGLIPWLTSASSPAATTCDLQFAGMQLEVGEEATLWEGNSHEQSTRFSQTNQKLEMAVLVDGQKRSAVTLTHDEFRIDASMTTIDGDLDITGLITNSFRYINWDDEDYVVNDHMTVPVDMENVKNVTVCGMSLNGSTSGTDSPTNTHPLVCLPGYNALNVNNVMQMPQFRKSGTQLIIVNDLQLRYQNWRKTGISAFNSTDLWPATVLVCSDPKMLNYGDAISPGQAVNSQYINTSVQNSFIVGNMLGKFIALLPGQMLRLTSIVHKVGDYEVLNWIVDNPAEFESLKGKITIERGTSQSSITSNDYTLSSTDYYEVLCLFGHGRLSHTLSSSLTFRLSTVRGAVPVVNHTAS